MKTVVFLVALLAGSVAFAYGEQNVGFGRHVQETAVEYEDRICAAKRQLELTKLALQQAERNLLDETHTYIESNMMWADDDEFQRTVTK